MTGTVLNKWHNKIFSVLAGAGRLRFAAFFKRQLPAEENMDPAASVRRALLLIRCVLLLLTSVYYLAEPLSSPAYIKIIVVLAMLTATALAASLYGSAEMKALLSSSLLKEAAGKRENTTVAGVSSNLILLITVETVGIALLILPTGGIDSPFVWYAINPVLAAAVYLPFIYCWWVLALFLAAAVAASAVYPGISGSLFNFFHLRSGVILVFIFATSLMQVAVYLYRNLIKAYSSLAKAHRDTEKSLQYISSLYQALEAFSSQEDEAQLAGLLAAYTEKLCGGPGICLIKKIIDEDEEHEEPVVLRVYGAIDPSPLQGEIYQAWREIRAGAKTTVRPVEGAGGNLLCTTLFYQGECFGVLACLSRGGEGLASGQPGSSLAFLSKLGGITMGRIKSDRLWGRLLVSEEQNRIASEIHDGVAQYLFSMVCALHILAGEESHLQEKKVQEKLKLLSATANRASRELRASIYRLSPRWNGENIFIDNLASYLDELGRLNNIGVDLRAEGSEENLSPVLRKALYRIVREAGSNAIRHGKCSTLRVMLSMVPGRTELLIEDNGCGFKAEENHTQKGLGINNMKQLAERFSGQLSVESLPGQGTLIRCVIPNK